MRGGARLVVMVTGALLLIPGSAAANGGAYFDLDRTHVTPGERTAVRAYVFVPERKQHLLEQGPFYVYLLPKGAWIREGRPVPDEAIRLGALTLEPERRETFELELEFNVPEVPSGFYSLGACNDPCTLSGLREPLSGELSIVETPREADLLTRQFKLETRIWRLRQDVRRAERRLERATTQLAQSQEDNGVLAEMVNEARGELRAAKSQPPAPAAVEAEERPLVDGRVLIATALLLVAAAALRRRRRPAGVEIPSPNGKPSAAVGPRSDWSDWREPAGRNR